MIADFEAVSVAMSQPDADLDALTNKMSRLQVSSGCIREWKRAITSAQGDAMDCGRPGNHGLAVGGYLLRYCEVGDFKQQLVQHQGYSSLSAALAGV